jgi:hypothetical protein
VEGDALRYYKAWYRAENDADLLDPGYPEWVALAESEEEAERKILSSMGRQKQERHYKVHLMPILDEDEGTVAFASARQLGQAVM